MDPRLSGHVLFLGNNDESTDLAVTKIAETNGTHNHGLITDPQFVPAHQGFYHTTVVDIPWGSLLQVCGKFDTIVMLDQPQAQWSHWKCLQATCKLMLKLESQGKHTVFRENHNVARILYWIELVYQKNPSFCIYPWINFYNDGQDLKLCSRDQGTVTTLHQLQDWRSDANYGDIRQKMLAGELLPDHCKTCYDYESKGMESYRQFETMDWVTNLELDSIDDLAGIAHPYFYEVQLGNNCNIKCRGCQPEYSEPIAREWKRFKISMPGSRNDKVSNHYSLDAVSIDSLDAKSSVYFQGGEPTIMPEVRDFLKQCINKKRTDFFLTMCTNGVKFSQELLDLMAHFPNTNFSFSLDGFDRVNDYWRWGSKWNRVIENAHRMQDLGHSVSINTVPGLYNVTNLHLLLEFLDREFPFSAIYMQVNYFSWQSAYNHPMKDLVIESMQRCQQTSIYNCNGKSCQTAIDSLLEHYSRDPVCDINQLRNFFTYNDQLDRVRGSRLADYIPELEQARSFLQ